MWHGLSLEGNSHRTQGFPGLQLPSPEGHGAEKCCSEVFKCPRAGSRPFRIATIPERRQKGVPSLLLHCLACPLSQCPSQTAGGLAPCCSWAGEQCHVFLGVPGAVLSPAPSASDKHSFVHSTTSFQGHWVPGTFLGTEDAARGRSARHSTGMHRCLRMSSVAMSAFAGRPSATQRARSSPC